MKKNATAYNIKTVEHSYMMVMSVLWKGIIVVSCRRIHKVLKSIVIEFSDGVGTNLKEMGVFLCLCEDVNFYGWQFTS